MYAVESAISILGERNTKSLSYSSTDSPTRGPTRQSWRNSECLGITVAVPKCIAALAALMRATLPAKQSFGNYFSECPNYQFLRKNVAIANLYHAASQLQLNNMNQLPKQTIHKLSELECLGHCGPPTSEGSDVDDEKSHGPELRQAVR